MTIKESEALEFRPKDNELFSPETADQQVQFIQKIMKAVMHEDVHYGKIPGCGDKPTLLKPGAEKLSMVFRLSPTFDIVKTNLERGHREYEITCLIKDINSERVQGEGVGMATSMESKWRYRKSERFCPACSAEAIIKNNFGQGDFKDGWMCWKKKDGCGEQFLKGDRAITDQIVQKVENDNPADQFNTVLKIAKKRAHVDAILTVLAASDCFAQDLEDMENKPTNENKTKGEDAGKNGKQPKPKPKTKTGGKKKKLKETEVLETITDEEGEELVKIAKDNNWTEDGYKQVLIGFGFKQTIDITVDKVVAIREQLAA